MKDMKAMARPFLALYAMALVIALLGRIGLAVAGGTGVLASTTSRPRACRCSM